MLERLNDLLVRMMDPVLGWILYLPRDVRLFLVALMTALILVYVRKWTTNQPWLKLADADQIRLDALIKDAKKQKDKEAVKRHQQTIAQIKLASLKYEGKPLLWAIIPILFLATWCFGRLGFVPPKDGETVVVKAYFPNTAIGRVGHVVPCQGIRAENGWVQAVDTDRPLEHPTRWQQVNAWLSAKMGMTTPLEGAAVWKLNAAARDVPYDLKMVVGGKVYEFPLLVGAKRYEPTMKVFTDGILQAVEVQLKPLKLFGIVDGMECVALPPWLAAYLLIAVPFAMLFRRWLSVY